MDDDDDEDVWRETSLGLLSDVHTIGGLSDTSFEIVTSKYSVRLPFSSTTARSHCNTHPFSKDLAIEMECESFKWRWETSSVGHRISAEIISKQLVFPLITASHVAFATTEPVNEMSDIDLEKVWRCNFSLGKGHKNHNGFDMILGRRQDRSSGTESPGYPRQEHNLQGQILHGATTHNGHVKFRA
jgi:hypothetical protein